MSSSTSRSTGGTKLAIRDTISDYIPNPTFVKVAVPGAAGYDVTKGGDGMDERRPASACTAPAARRWSSMPGIDAFFDPEPRLELMKEMGIDRTLLWPTLASVLEERVADDPDVAVAVIHAFNEWMHEHWTFVYSDAIYSTPIISLAGGNDTAIKELEYIAERGGEDLPDPGGAGADVEGPQVVRAARVRPVLGAGAGARPRRRHALRGSRLHPLHQRVGRHAQRVQRLPEQRLPAFITLASEKSNLVDAWRRSSVTVSRPDSRSSVHARRVRGHLDPALLHEAPAGLGGQPVLFDENPVEVFNRNVWLHVFHEADPKGLIDLGIPVDHLMFGSDFPHPEGMADPLAYSEVVEDLPVEQQELIMGGSLEKAMKVGKYAA